jgi:hypothetical protein
VRRPHKPHQRRQPPPWRLQCQLLQTRGQLCSVREVVEQARTLVQVPLALLIQLLL